VFFSLLSLACHQPTGADRAPRQLERADAVAAADFDGDGVDEPVLIVDGAARWPSGEADLGGAVQITARAPDGSVLLGTGSSRALPDAPARVWRLGSGGATLLWESAGPRNQVTELRAAGDRIWLGVFGDQTRVSAGWLEGDQHKVEVQEKLGTRQLPLGDLGVLVGRVYGDQPRSDGDLRLLRDGGVVRPLPTLRGVRSLAAADLDGDGGLEILVGDGWHYAYGSQAVARVRLLEAPEWTTGRTLATFDDEYSVRQIEVTGGGDILATGTKAVHLLRRDALGWRDLELAPLAETGNAVLFQDAGGPAVLLSGDPARIVPLP
jgi:hypothetical protein